MNTKNCKHLNVHIEDHQTIETVFEVVNGVTEMIGDSDPRHTGIFTVECLDCGWWRRSSVRQFPLWAVNYIDNRNKVERKVAQHPGSG